MPCYCRTLFSVPSHTQYIPIFLPTLLKVQNQPVQFIESGNRFNSHRYEYHITRKIDHTNSEKYF